MTSRDTQIRMRAFAFLEDEKRKHGDVLAREILRVGFDFEGQRVPLVSPQGIFRPAACDMPLTITTAPHVEGKPVPYDDQFNETGLLQYKYRGTDPGHRDNVGLREAMRLQTPLIYLFGIEPGVYMPVWPVFIVGDDPVNLTFTVAADDLASKKIDQGKLWTAADDNRVIPLEPPSTHVDRRAYVTFQAKRRLHQARFRAEVLRTYQERCAICRLRRQEFLDAAHILPDGHPRGQPIIQNGLALCKLHHTAYDGNFLGIRPDYVIEIRKDLLEEQDGPVLLHGLKDFHRAPLQLPKNERSRPDPVRLEERFGEFKKAV